MRSAAARGRALALSILLLVPAACPDSSAPRRRPVAGSPSVETPGRRGGELVVAYPHEPPTLNPFAPGGESPATRDLVRPLMPALYRLRPGGGREPWLLAEEPVPVATATGWEVPVRLRAGAVWSDGKPIVAADLRFTWRAVTDRRNRVATRDGYDQITDVRVDAPDRATLVFRRPFRRVADLFSAGLGVLPAHALERAPWDRALADAWPVSGGPFVLKGWTKGLEIVYERNAAFWGTKAVLDRIRVRFVPDVVTAFRLLSAGKVDVLGPYEAVDVARRGRAIAGTRVTSDLGASWAVLALNARARDVSAVATRQALAHALDRAAAVTGLVRDDGLSLDSLNAGAERQLSVFGAYGARPGESRRLLGRRPAPVTITIAAPASDELPGRVLRAMYVQGVEGGFDLQAVGLDADRLWSEWLRGSRFEAALLVVRDPPGGALRSRYESGRRPPAGENWGGIADAGLDRALRAADEAEPGGPRPSQADLALERKLAELVPAIPLWRVRVTLVASRAARGVEANASADGFLWNAESWWRAA